MRVGRPHQEFRKVLRPDEGPRQRIDHQYRSIAYFPEFHYRAPTFQRGAPTVQLLKLSTSFHYILPFFHSILVSRHRHSGHSRLQW